ncbi:MAG: hypothetical protein P1U35_12240 [Cycloclasticus sp.]|nr:hypothetical protein [Cycloclasticus sp.]
MSKTEIILDKCFLQGASQGAIEKMTESFQLLMPDVLFYELISSCEPGRSRCFSKFPNSPNPIPVTQHIGALLNHEITAHQPSGLPSENLVEVDYRFNPELATGEYEFSERDLQTCSEIEEELKSDISALIQRVNSLEELFPNFHERVRKEQEPYVREIMNAVANDVSDLATFLSQLELPGEKAMPPRESLNQNWAIFRWLQVQLLFAIDIARRYGVLDIAKLTEKQQTSFEHDVLDSHYLILGILQKSLATKEKKLIHFFKLLCPDGTLVEK